MSPDELDRHADRADHAPSLYAVLEAAPNAIVAVDRDGRIDYVNRQATRTFGYTAEELVGRSVEMLLPMGVAERHVRHREGFMAQPTARPMGIGRDLAGLRRDGSAFPVEISLSPVAGPDGLLVFATVVDITQRKAAERQLLQAQKLESIGRLAGGIAHDFNNMLFAIRGYTELLALDLAELPQDMRAVAGASQSMRGIADAAERATALTARLLAFSSQQLVDPVVLGINTTVRAIEPMLRRLVGEHLELRIHLGAVHDRVRADPSQIDQVVLNLVVNARDALPGGGHITIETFEAFFEEAYSMEHFDVDAGPYVGISVSDDGVGMDHETRAHVFEPFFTTKEAGKGTGLGLATTYGIVRQAGGHIWLYSEPGIGTSFKVFLPQYDAVPPEGRPAEAPSPLGRGETVLVVEDEPSVREVTARLLSRAGYAVVAVPGPREALEELQLGMTHVDVLVSDVVMPGMNGMALADRVTERYPDVAVVLLSGYTPETLDLERSLAGGARFASKPVTTQRLLATIREAQEVVAARRAVRG
jgi:PAS domain S-box-containing protein